jgi:hypothetical protein
MSTTQRATGRVSRHPLFLLMITSVFSLACSPGKQQSGQDAARSTATPQPAQTLAQTNASPDLNKPAGSSAPALSEVQEAVKRVCVSDLAIDMNQREPFIVGDFNGDGSEDLAAIVRPARGALPKVNSDYANWIIEDPRKVILPDPNKAVQRLPKPPPPVFVQANDILLLVLHGYQQAGWRHHYARQAFLLRNAVGENVRTQSVNEVVRIGGNKNPVQQRSGDVIGEKLTGHDGFLYWTNGRYAWWDNAG